MKKLLILLAFLLLSVSNSGFFANAADYHDSELLYKWNLAVFSSKSSGGAIYETSKLPSEGIESDDVVIAQLAGSIVAGKKSDYEKARAIYCWVVDNTWYDNDIIKNNAVRGDESALETYRNKRGACVGYANLTIALFRAADIPAIFASGHALGADGDLEKLFDVSSPFVGSNHCWTEAFVNERWIIIDTAWGSKNIYEDGVYSTRKASGSSYSHFDVSLRDFSMKHRYAPSGYPVSAIIIPDGVTGIGAFAFSNCKDLKSVIIAGSVESIGMGAFSGCAALESVVIPDSVTSIGSAAFLYCKGLKSISIPDGVATIGDNMFTGCTGLERVIIPNSVTHIGANAFTGCDSLKSIYIPAGVVSIDGDAFEGVPGVTIAGVAGSFAETYAAENSIPFKVGGPDAANGDELLYTRRVPYYQFWGHRFFGLSAYPPKGQRAATGSIMPGTD